MSSFIKLAACNGCCPSHLGNSRFTKRSDLVARMVRERRVARFIFAPSGYGKTSLAADYCDTVLGFSHVFWIKATSPCFIRDLDAGTLAEAIFDADKQAAMAVFDDVPRLDEERARMFSDQIDHLLQRNCEVLVLATPSAAAGVEPEDGRMVLRAVDLLLSNRELAAMRASAEPVSTSERMEARAAKPFAASSGDTGGYSGEAVSAVSVASRIPALAWSKGPDDLNAFLAALFQEEFVPSLAAALVSMAILGMGDVSEVLEACGIDADAVGQIARDYPHMGIDENADRFDFRLFPIESVVPAVRQLVLRMVAAEQGGRREEMVASWADKALQQNMCERACDIVRLLMPRKARGAWLVARAYKLLRAGSFLAVKRLVDASGKNGPDIRRRLAVIDVVCRLRLDDRAGAVVRAKRLAFADAVEVPLRLLCLVVLARHATGKPTERAKGEIAELLDNADDAELSRFPFATMLARGAMALEDGIERLSELIEYECIACDRQRADALCIMSAWLFDELMLSAPEAKREGRAIVAPAAVTDFVIARIEGDEPLDADMPAVIAGLAMEHARMKGVLTEQGIPSASAMFAMRQAEVQMLGQRMQFKLDETHERELRLDRLETHPDVMMPAVDAASLPLVRKSIPTLYVRMFGRFEASLGGVPVNDDLIQREKVRRLFVMLALNSGRELSRDWICEHLWPQSRLDVSRKNYYNIISALKRALTLPDGTCPYLIRHRNSCALDERNMVSDVMRLDEICREFLFGEPDDAKWCTLYREVDRDFSDDMLATETSDEYLIAQRNDLRSRLVDALTSASQRITDAGNPQHGIWFARSAIGHDKTREDAYIALMQAQNAAQQRAAAMYTFVRMRRVLAEELGVDPSPEAQRLYESILMVDGGTVTAAC